jgi:hypothetical protein
MDYEAEMERLQDTVYLSDWGRMNRRIESLEREQSLMGKRVAELEAQLREENTHPIPGDIDFLESVREIQWLTGDGALRMIPPEQEDDPR